MLNGNTLEAAILDSAARHERADAVRLGGERLNYGQLVWRALRWATWIDAAAGANPRPVAIIGDRSILAVELILASLLSGRAYSFLYPGEKAPRLSAMLDTLRPGVVLDLWGEAASLAIDTRVLRPHRVHFPEHLPPYSPKGGEFAYVLFTSGSTGLPKGAVIGQGAAMSAQRALIAETGLGAGDLVVNEVEFVFDVSTFDLFASLMTGATVEIVPTDKCEPPTRFREFLSGKRISSLFTVPTVTESIFNSNFSGPNDVTINRLLLTGELIRPKHTTGLGQFIRGGGRLFNMYGMTECPWALSGDVTLGDMRRPNVLETAGREMPAQARIDDDGRLWLSGEGLFDGYVDPDFDFKAPSIPVERYDTGDGGRILEDGRIELTGRRDRQVRRGGYRIELAEIEHWIETNPEVETAMATYDEQQEQIRVHVTSAFAVPDESGAPLLEVLRQEARRLLPSYMLPEEWRLIGAAPRTSSGKRSYPALKEMEPLAWL